jgi:glycine betaine/choline ABC-type transport system substrate-binding protein
VIKERIEKWFCNRSAASLVPRVIAGLACVALVFLAAGCSREAPPTIAVASRPTADLSLVGEIVAQMLEKRLGMEVVRSYDLGSTPLAYQSILMQQVDIVPEDINAITTTVLREEINPDPVIALERVRQEMDRLARVRVLEPLGIRPMFTMVVTRSTAERRKVKTLTDAFRAGSWVSAHTSEFPDRPDGYKAMMAKYPLRQEVAPTLLKPFEAYERLAGGHIEMFAAYITDGQLANPDLDLVRLEDDKGAFREGNTCLLVRREVISRFEQLKPLLDQLSGRFDNERMRKLNYEVAVKKRTPAEVARQFLVDNKLAE